MNFGLLFRHMGDIFKRGRPRVKSFVHLAKNFPRERKKGERKKKEISREKGKEKREREG